MEKLNLSVVQSSNQQEREFLRVEGEPGKGKFGELIPKVGFIPFDRNTGESKAAMEALTSGAAEIVWGSRNNRQGLFNISIVEAGYTGDERQSDQATTQEEKTLVHKA